MNIRMLGYNISNEMYKQGMSYRELGKRINKEHPTVSNHIHEPQRITVDEMFKIANALGVSWKKLLEGVE